MEQVISTMMLNLKNLEASLQQLQEQLNVTHK